MPFNLFFNKRVFSLNIRRVLTLLNGVAERKNRHLLDVVRTLTLEPSVPSRFWVEAISTAVYLINRLPSPTLHLDSPYSRLFGVPLDYNSLHVFGCICFVHLPHVERHKLDVQTVQCAFLGYSNSHKGFVCYDADANRPRISYNVIFFENQYFFPSGPDSVSSSSLLPSFDDKSSFTSRFKPGLVYHDVTHCLFLLLHLHLILSCKHLVGLLGSPGPQSSMVFLLLLFRYSG